MSLTASRSRRKRSAGSGHSAASTGVSFIDSPDPTPRKKRPGNISAMVAAACATIAGWYRKVGVTTLVPIRTREVFAPSAPSQDHENGAWPPVSRQGWK